MKMMTKIEKNIYNIRNIFDGSDFKKFSVN